MGALLVKRKDKKPKTPKGYKAAKDAPTGKRNKRIKWSILSKKEVEAARPKDAYEYVV